MPWLVLYHPEVEHDLRRLGRTEARNVLKVLEERVANGEPDKLGKALTGDLAGVDAFAPARHGSSTRLMAVTCPVSSDQANLG